MSEAIKMNAKDAIAAKMAECWITLDGNRYNFMTARNLEARLEKTKVEVPILGRMNTGHKAVGTNGTGSASFYKNTSIWNRYMKRFQDTGEDVYFDILIINEDPTSAAGRQTTILKDCNVDSALIAAFDVDGEFLEEDMDFTFEHFEMPEEFIPLEGML